MNSIGVKIFQQILAFKNVIYILLYVDIDYKRQDANIFTLFNLYCITGKAQGTVYKI